MSLGRGLLRSYAGFALCVFLGGWVVPFFEAHPLGFDDDAACSAFAPLSASAGPAGQLTSADTTDRSPSHCVLCHLMRALNGSHTADVAQLAGPAAKALTDAFVHDPVLSHARSASSSRGPPAIL